MNIHLKQRTVQTKEVSPLKMREFSDPVITNASTQTPNSQPGMQQSETLWKKDNHLNIRLHVPFSSLDPAALIFNKVIRA